MCLCCICCTSSKCCTFLSSILTGIEAIIFASLNLTLILGYVCKIEPPQKSNLTPGFLFIEDVWSWFFYSEALCEKNQGPDYQPPPWISDIPESFSYVNFANAVSPQANYGYQITYFILHVLWFFSALLLLYGNARKLWKYFLPWIIIGIVLTALDTIIGAFYIKLMDDTSMGWEYGRAIFSMQFLYFRGFFLYILNIIAITIIAVTFWTVYLKRRKEEKLQRKLHNNRSEIVVQTTIVTSPSRMSSTSSSFSEMPMSRYPDPSQTSYAIQTGQLPNQSTKMDDPCKRCNDPTKEPAPTKYRPFSYMNPAYRPADPYDIEGMKTHAPGPAKKGYDSAAFQEEETVNAIEGHKLIPRASLVKKSYQRY